jgi:orotidine-5'-phosphate decarboxylase
VVVAMKEHPADRLMNAVTALAAPVCVGLDPVVGRLPDEIRPTNASASVEAMRAFTLGVLDAIAGRVPCVKLQSACFERYGFAGVEALEQLVGEAHERDLVVILDAKRGDIGISAEHYAAAAFDQPHPADWITINAYLGEDGITPFLPPGNGAFALVRTSNPGGDALQMRRLDDGRTVAECVADLVATIGASHLGACGYSRLGAVVGATKPTDARALRERMPQQLLLVPGYGAQGGGAAGVKPCFDARGRGAIVTASRSVIYAFDPGASDWQRSIADAADRLADEIGRIVGLR